MAYASATTRAETAEIIQILKGNRGLILAITALFLAVAVGYILITPKAFKATSAVIIDVRGRASPSDPETVPSGLIPDIGLIETQMRVMASPSVLRRVIASERLLEDSEFGTPKPGLLASLFGNDAPADPAAQAVRQQRTLDALTAALVLRRSERSYVVEIDLYASSPERAKTLADAVAKAYVEDLAASREELVGQDMGIVAQKLSDLRDRVDETSRRVSDFKLQNGLSDANGRNITEQQLANAVDDLTRARERTGEAKSRYEQIQRMMKAGRPTDAVGDALRSPSLERLRGQYADLMRQQANLRTTLGERHPALAEVESQLRDARQLINEEVARIGVGAANEYQVARDSEADNSRRVDALRQTVDQRSNVMLQLRSLERDAETTRLAYERYLRVREINSNGPSPVVARIIQHAALPLFAALPRKGPALAVGLFMGLFVGIIAALLKDYISMPARGPNSGLAYASGAVGPPMMLTGLARRNAAAYPNAPVMPAAEFSAQGHTATAVGSGLPVLVDLPLITGMRASSATPQLRRTRPSGRLHALAVEHDDTSPLYLPSPEYLTVAEELFESLPLAGLAATAVKVLITSFGTGTGKTMLSYSLARHAARLGISTLLVESNTETPILGSLLPASARAGLVGMAESPRVGYMLNDQDLAELCIVPILEDEDRVVRQLQNQAIKPDAAIMPSHARLIIFDGGIMSNDDVVELAGSVDIVLVVAGPSDRAYLRREDPAARLDIDPQIIAGYVGSPVETKAA